jgi:hypothetical protein
VTRAGSATLVVIALQREHPFLTASYPNSGFAFFEGTMALGVVIVGEAALVAATAGRAWDRPAGLALLALAIALFVLYRAPVNVLSATPSSAAMLAGASAFLLVSGRGSTGDLPAALTPSLPPSVRRPR